MAWARFLHRFVKHDLQVQFVKIIIIYTGTAARASQLYYTEFIKKKNLKPPIGCEGQI